MNAIASQMRTLSSKARVLTASVRDDTRKREEADLKIHVVAWKKREQEKAKKAIAQLPVVIKGVAEKGKNQLIVRVRVTDPYVRLDICEVYKVLNMWAVPSLLEFETPSPRAPLSLYKIKNLRDGARSIARWALKEGFVVYFREWDEKGEIEILRHSDIFDIDHVVTPVIPSSSRGGWPVHEGFSLAW